MSVDTCHSATALLAGIVVGYGFTTTKGLFVGGEMGGSFPNKPATIQRFGVVYTGEVFVNHISVQDYVNGDFLIGYRPTEPLLTHAKGGVVLSRFELSQQFTPSIPNSSFSDSSLGWGARVGAGVNYSVIGRFSLGLDYTYTKYQTSDYLWSTFDVQFSKQVSSHYITLSGILGF